MDMLWDRYHVPQNAYVYLVY